MLLQTTFNSFSFLQLKRLNFIYTVPMNGSRAFNNKSNYSADMKHTEKSASKISAFLNVMSPHFRYQLIVMNCNLKEFIRNDCKSDR